MTGRIWPNAELSERAKDTREHVVKRFWFSNEEDKFDLDNAIQTKAEFSYAIAVQDSQRACGSVRKLFCATGKTTFFGLRSFPATQSGASSFHVCDFPQIQRQIMKTRVRVKPSVCRGLSVSLLVSMMVSEKEACQVESAGISTRVEVVEVRSHET